MRYARVLQWLCTLPLPLSLRSRPGDWALYYTAIGPVHRPSPSPSLLSEGRRAVSRNSNLSTPGSPALRLTFDSPLSIENN
jgi:hypothetical protein